MSGQSNHNHPSALVNPRMTAFKVLCHVEGEGGYSTISLNAALSGSSLAPRDKAFAAKLVYGVLENEYYLDYVINSYSKVKAAKLEPSVRCILRMAVYQMAFLGTPDAAAVNESVKLAKQCKLFRATGFINGVLRSFIRDGKTVRLPDKQQEPDLYRSLQYSCPLWLVKLWQEAYGSEICDHILQSLSERPPIFARVNPLKLTVEELCRSLAEQGVKAVPSDRLPDCLLLKHTGSVRELPQYRRGEFHVQDGSSQLCCLIAAPKSGSVVYDVCAAPGGKSFTMAEWMGDEGEIVSCDLHPHRVTLIAEGAERLGLHCVKAQVRDALTQAEQPCADLVLCDVPCSGLGIIRRKPDIKQKSQEEIRQLPALQYEILERSAALVKPGGRLVYSTCTLHPAENAEVLERFLAAHTDFHPCPIELPDGFTRAMEESSHCLTVFPHMADTDGFFISTVIREG